MQCLLYCLQAGKSYFSTLLSLPTEGWLYRPFVSSAELLSVVITMSRLLLLDAEGWDLNLARQTLDLAAVSQSLIEQFQVASALLYERLGRQAPDGSGELVEEDMFLKYAGKMDFIRNWFIARIAGEASMAPSELEQGLLPEDWSLLANGDNQLWLGLLPQGNWHLNF